MHQPTDCSLPGRIARDLLAYIFRPFVALGGPFLSHFLDRYRLRLSKVFDLELYHEVAAALDVDFL